MKKLKDLSFLRSMVIEARILPRENLGILIMKSRMSILKVKLLHYRHYLMNSGKRIGSLEDFSGSGSMRMTALEAKAIRNSRLKISRLKLLLKTPMRKINLFKSLKILVFLCIITA